MKNTYSKAFNLLSFVFLVLTKLEFDAIPYNIILCSVALIAAFISFKIERNKYTICTLVLNILMIILLILYIL